MRCASSSSCCLIKQPVDLQCNVLSNAAQLLALGFSCGVRLHLWCEAHFCDREDDFSGIQRSVTASIT
jgi:hypothetical protein